jgi:histone acetyltransferase (RNA polymerase elongator complex component)
MKHFTIPVFIPQKCCPFQCVFCNQQKITGKDDIPGPTDITRIIDEHLATIPVKNSVIEVGFFGGNFTGIPYQEQEQYLEAVQPYLADKRISSIRLSTRPDYISQEILDLLKKYKVETIELGAQSFDDEVLTRTARGHSASDITVASKMIHSSGFRLGLQMMIGLPGDTLEKAILTTQEIISLGAIETRIYPVLVIKGTKMEEWYKQGLYQPLSLDETIYWLKTIMPMFEEAGVEITRVGLHSSVGLLSGKELVAGPFHTSIRELAMTEVWWDRLKDLINQDKHGKLQLAVHPSQYNFAIGYFSKNRKKLLKHFSSVSFIKDKSLKNNQFYVDHS